MLLETDTAAERNAGLYDRYPVREMCPNPLYLQIFMQQQVPITISADAHYLNDLGRCVDGDISEASKSDEMNRRAVEQLK